jgi:hypothetical protein
VKNKISLQIEQLSGVFAQVKNVMYLFSTASFTGKELAKMLL